MSNSINLSSASLRTPALEISQRNPKEQTVKQAPPPIATLSDDVLAIIFTYITENGRQTETVLNLQKVCTRWDKVIESELLSRYWAGLSERITSTALKTYISSINLSRDLIKATLNEVLGYDQSNKIPGRSHFHLFCDLTQNLIQRGIPIPHHSPVLGFHADVYEQAQAAPDLEKIWTQKILPKIQFAEGAPIPTNAAAIRAWLQDPINTPAISRITVLNLSGMGLQVLPSEIGSFHQLQMLYLANNNLTTLPPQIGNLEQLKTLFLVNNNLTTLPPEIGNLNQLLQLPLANNNLTTLPHELGNLYKLQELSLANNNLTTLPHELGNLDQLQTLSLANNNLTTLPAWIGNFHQLQVLSLDSNNLTILPAWIGNLRQLQMLYLRNNNLTTLPLEIGNLRQLQMLYLYGNPLMLALDKNLQDVYNHNYYENEPTKKLTLAQYQEKYESNATFDCTTPLASLCQEIHKGSNLFILQKRFEALSAKIQGQIIEKIGATNQEGLFRDRTLFVKSVIAVASEKLNKLGADKKKEIYRRVEEQGKVADRDIICLIDTMELATQE